MQEPNAVIVRSGDKVLLCLTEEPSDEYEALLSSQLSGLLDGVTVAVIGGVRALVVQREEEGE